MVDVADSPMTESKAIVPASGLVVGADIADMSDDEFEYRLTALVKRQERIDRIKRAAMVEGSDYGNVPGTDRPVLLKGGAEKLTNMNGLVARIETEEIIRPLLSPGDALMSTLEYVSGCPSMSC